MSLQTELDTLQQNLQTAKDAIATNLTSKGVQTEPSATLTTMAENINSITSGGGTGDLDFTKLGYKGTPQNMIDGIAYGEKIKNEWNPNTTELVINNDLELVYLPHIDTLNITKMNFKGCKNLEILPDNLIVINVKDASNLFRGCHLKRLPKWDMSRKLTNMSYMFADSHIEFYNNDIQFCGNCTNMEGMFTNATSGNKVFFTDFINALNTETSNVTNFKDCFANTHLGVLTKFNCASATSLIGTFAGANIEKFLFTNSYTTHVTDFTDCFKGANIQTLEKLNLSSAMVLTDTFKNLTFDRLKINGIGNSKLQEYDFTDLVDWKNVDIVYSLITNSYNRHDAGWSVVTIKLHPKAYKTLTTEQIQQIESKGYKVVTEYEPQIVEINTKINDIKTLI